MADNPLLPFSDAALIQLNDSQWLLWLAGLELLRQIHFFISEKSPGYHRFWSEKVFGGFNRAIHRRFSDWTRYRLSRLIKIVLFLVLFAVVAGADPRHLADPGDLPGARAALPGAAADPAAAVRVLLHRVPVHRAVLAALARRRRHLLPGRHHHPLLRRLGPGPRRRAGQGEHRLPGEPGRDRGEGRLRALRHAAVGTARHRQDADGRGRRGRDRQAVRLRRPRRVQQHVHGRRHPQGQVAVPEAAQARAPLRRRDRLLRRGRRARQPRRARAGRAGRRPHRAPPAVPEHGLPRHDLPVRRHALAARPRGDAGRAGARRRRAAGSSWAA